MPSGLDLGGSKFFIAHTYFASLPQLPSETQARACEYSRLGVLFLLEIVKCPLE